MPLFSTTPIPVPQQIANRLLSCANDPFDAMIRSGQQGWALLWKSQGVSPVDIVTALGNNALSLFQLAQLNVNTVVQAATVRGQKPPVIPLIPSTWTIAFTSTGAGILTPTSTGSSTSTSLIPPIGGAK